MIEKMYKNYLSKVGLSEITMSKIQRQETRRAFMAGVATFFNYMTGEITELPDEEGEKRLTQIQRELNVFYNIQN